jgi:hypothetical protein
MPYITQQEYTTYANERGIHVNNGHLAQDIILSADFIDTYYKFKGEPLDPAQPNALPTDQVSIADIKKAALKACEMQQAGLLTLDLAATANGIVSSESKSLDGVGSKSVTYEAGSRNTYKRSTPQLDLLLRPFLAFNSGLVRG